MSRRTAAWFAWPLWALCVAFITVAQVLDFLTPSHYAGEDTVLLDALFWALSVIYVPVGTLVALASVLFVWILGNWNLIWP